MKILAFIDDWQISAKLAKITTDFSFDLTFCESLVDPLNIDSYHIVIVAMQNIEDIELNILENKFKKNNIYVLGFMQNLKGNNVKDYKQYGFSIILSQKELFNNLESILKKISNAI